MDVVIQLQLLSGEQAGKTFSARRLPIHLGRAPTADLQIEAEGVWAQHARIGLDSQTTFSLATHPGALTSLNGQPVEQSPLRNGDVIQMGAAELRFGLGPTFQRSLRVRESLLWLSLGLLCLGQVALIYWLEG